MLHKPIGYPFAPCVDHVDPGVAAEEFAPGNFEQQKKDGTQSCLLENVLKGNLGALYGTS